MADEALMLRWPGTCSQIVYVSRVCADSTEDISYAGMDAAIREWMI
jgi:hypothetical protein